MKDFQDSCNGGHLGFLTGMILAIFDLQVTLMFPTEFQVTVAILDFRSKPFYLFLIYKSPQCFLQSFKSTGLLVQEKKQKIDCQYGHHGG